MSALSSDSSKRLAQSLTSPSAANEASDMLNKADALWSQSSKLVAAAIVATSTSTTTDFASLAVGDLVAMVPAVAGNSIFYTVATAGTLPAAAVIGNLYIALRSKSSPSASAIIL